MKGFLTKIAELDAVSEVILLSLRGEPLFCRRLGAINADENTLASWQEIITSLESPAVGDILFARGRYYLHRTSVGYLIVGMQNDASLNTVRLACSTVSSKLENDALRRQTLLRLLQEIDDSLKPNVIKELMLRPDRELARVLLNQLKRRDQFLPQARERLLLCICQALGYCPAPEAVGLLKEIETSDTNLSQTVRRAAGLARRQLEREGAAEASRETQPLQPQSPPSPASTPPRSPSPPRPAAIMQAHDAAIPEAQQIRELLQSGQKKEALACILEAITTAARKKDFITAEKLRTWLMEIDSMALSEIIQAAEVIEEERKAAIDKEHLRTWKALIEQISLESFSALYHNCSWQTWEPGAMIVSQGELKPNLYFVNKGKIQLLIKCEGRSEPVTLLEPGNIFGAETFFEPSVWTVEAKSLGVELFMLSRETFHKLAEHHPALADTLQSHAGKPLLTRNFFSRTRKTRRRHERKEAHNRVAIVLLDEQDRETEKSAKGDLIDISAGGLALSFHASRKKAADALLGRKVRFAIVCHDAEPQVVRVGVVRAIKVHDPIGNRYSLHAEFTQPLIASELRSIGGTSR